MEEGVNFDYKIKEKNPTKEMFVISLSQRSSNLLLPLLFENEDKWSYKENFWKTYIKLWGNFCQYYSSPFILPQLFILILILKRKRRKRERKKGLDSSSSSYFLKEQLLVLTLKFKLTVTFLLQKVLFKIYIPLLFL